MQKVKDVYRKKIITAPTDEPIYDVLEKLRGYKIGCVVITDGEMRPVGMVTESDMLDIFMKTRGLVMPFKAKDIMTPTVLTCTPEDTLEHVSVLMASNRIRRVPVVDAGKVIGLVSYRDLTEDLRKSYYILDEIIEDKSNKDALTGLYNKGFASEQLKYQFELSKRLGTPVFVCVFDLDHFKKVNDTYGHACGDKVLISAAQIIKECARTVDVVSRYGGEEFMITGFINDKKSALVMPERVRKMIASLNFMYEAKTIKLTVSGGVALSNEKLDQPDMLFKKADESLYRAKQDGRDRIYLHED